MSQTDKINELKEMPLNEDNKNSTSIMENKPGEFYLSHLQALILNKKLPPGYKLELEEVYTKTTENTNNFNNKKKKSNVSYI